MLPIAFEPGLALVTGSFLTNNTSDPVATNNRGVHFTVARSGVGTFVVTVRGGDPYFIEAVSSDCGVTEEATPSAIWCRITAIDPDGSGTAGATINISQLDDNATPAAADSTSKRIWFWVLFRLNKGGTDGSIY